MKTVAAISMLAGTLMLATAAAAQTPITPPAAKSEPKAEPKSEAKKTAPAARKPAVPETKPASPPPAATATPAPTDPNVDMVYGAFQRGEYKTTLELAIPRAQAG